MKWGLPDNWQLGQDAGLHWIFFHSLFFIVALHLALHLTLAGNSGHLTWVRLQQPQQQRYPFLTVRAIFPCVPAKVWLPTLGIFNVYTDVNACDCTWGLFRHHKSLHCKLTLEEKSFARPGNWTCISGTPVRRSNNWATSPPKIGRIYSILYFDKMVLEFQA